MSEPVDGRCLLILRLLPLSDRGEAAAVQSWIAAKTAIGNQITVLASNATLNDFQDLGVTVWPDGAPNGLLRMLALVRRISWGSFSAVYDLDQTPRTRAYRVFVRPCPPWHSMSDLRSDKHKAP